MRTASKQGELQQPTGGGEALPEIVARMIRGVRGVDLIFTLPCTFHYDVCHEPLLRTATGNEPLVADGSAGDQRGGEEQRNPSNLQADDDQARDESEEHEKRAVKNGVRDKDVLEYRSLAYIGTRLRELETQTIYGPDLESSETRLKIWSVLGATAEG